MFTSMWIAYPLDKSTCTGSHPYSGDWVSPPGISKSDQINVWDHSYNVFLGGDTYTDPFSTAGTEYYARGYQIPDADRQYNSTMVQQTYYAINSTPQIQNKFNGSIWGALETDIRNSVVNSQNEDETVYVITGPAFQKVGETKDILWILPRGDSKTCPVPNYYWKAVLRLKFNTDGSVQSAKSIGFWFEHKQYPNATYSNYKCSVNDIESWTGLDLFTNLPDGIEESVESNTDWQAFQNF